MRAKVISCCLALTLLSACSLPSLPKNKDWTHPREPNLRKEDQLFLDDSKFCEGKIGPATTGEAHDKALVDCLTRLGWMRKE